MLLDTDVVVDVLTVFVDEFGAVDADLLDVELEADDAVDVDDRVDADVLVAVEEDVLVDVLLADDDGLEVLAVPTVDVDSDVVLGVELVVDLLGGSNRAGRAGRRRRR